MKRKLNPIPPEIERLECNLSHLTNYCRPGFRPLDDDAWRDDFDHWRLRRSAFDIAKFGCWPERELLREFEADVLVLAGRERAIFPVWKAFLLVDRRKKKLRLKSCVNNLIRRAQRLLSGESELNKVVRLAKAGDLKARCSLSDMIVKPEKLDELLQAYRQMVIQRDRAEPLVHWTIDIGHPFAGDWGYIEKLHPTVDEFKTWQKNEKRRNRLRRHRSGKKIRSKSVSLK
jgi:hypothetical protein